MRASIPRRIERPVERFDHTTIDYKGNDDFRYDMKQISTASEHSTIIDFAAGCDNKKKIIVGYFPRITGVKMKKFHLMSRVQCHHAQDHPLLVPCILAYSKHRSSFRLSGNRLPLIFTIVLELLTFTRVLGGIQGACIH